jgi:hypothetical protein
MVRKWDNAFTFVLPAVTDGGGLASETREQGGRLGHLTVRSHPDRKTLSDTFGRSPGDCLLNVCVVYCCCCGFLIHFALIRNL